MGNAVAGCQGRAAVRRPGQPIVLSVVRTARWGLGAEEDVWETEVPEKATVRELKAKIQELYDLPQQTQRLSLGSAPEDPALEDDSPVEALEGKRVFLNPVGVTDLLAGLGGFPAQLAETVSSAAREMRETDEALRESLQGVTYSVTFERPQEAGGQAAGKKVRLDVDALAQMEDVQQMVEVEMFNAVGAEPAFLLFQGMPLPPQLTPYHAGIVDGTTVVVSREPPPDPAEQLLGMLAELGGDQAAAFAAAATAGIVPGSNVPAAMAPTPARAQVVGGGGARR